MTHVADLETLPDSGSRGRTVSHGEILKVVWKHLDLGTLDRDHPFHTPVFATVEDGFPEARMVVLRRFWRKPAELAFHAHSGSPKIAQIEANPRVAWQFYHPGERLQVRVRGRATVVREGKLFDEQWESTEILARRCYCGDAPTTLTDHPSAGLPEEFLHRRPTREESESGRRNFVVVKTAIEELDVLELSIKGHRRSLFTWREGELSTRWLTP